MSATYPTRVLLAFRSGGICAYPSCGRGLTYDAVVGSDTYTGEAAHIRGEKPKAARYDASMTEEERDDVRNLIYMCGDCHKIIDNVEADWPVAKLEALKLEHEKTVRRSIEDGFATVAFPELERAVGWVSSAQPVKAFEDFTITPPDQKIQKNSLSASSRSIILAGLSGQKTVADYVVLETQSDPDFPERLKSGFLAEYYAHRTKGITGDVLFEMMCAFSQRGLRNQADKIAGLAVLVYLFEICDVFEK